jgi:hypothetical protein
MLILQSAAAQGSAAGMTSAPSWPDPDGTRTAYLGEEILLQGMNTDSDITYLFVTGPNLPAAGGRLDKPLTGVIDGDPASFTHVDVGSNHRWQYRWQTAGIGLDAGTYTVYAESFPRSGDRLSFSRYTTVTTVFVMPAAPVFPARSTAQPLTLPKTTPTTPVIAVSPTNPNPSATGTRAPGYALPQALLAVCATGALVLRRL